MSGKCSTHFSASTSPLCLRATAAKNEATLGSLPPSFDSSSLSFSVVVVVVVEALLLLLLLKKLFFPAPNGLCKNAEAYFEQDASSR